MSTEPLLHLAPLRMDAILDKDSYLRLAFHLSNRNLGKGAFLSSEGVPITRDLRKGTLREKITSTWRCITSYDQLNPKPFTLVVYDRHPIEQTSTWAAVDLDWHKDEAPQRHHWLALQRLNSVANEWCEAGKLDALILEQSGRGAHLWLISRETRSVPHWWQLLQDLLSNANCTNLPGLEKYPASTVASSKGHALRLPGSVNVMRHTPRDGCAISTVLTHRGLSGLLALLPEPPSNNKSIYIGNALASALPGKDAKAKASAEEKKWLADCHIGSPRTRHNQARRLIAVTSFSRKPEDVLGLCEKLYVLASCKPITPLDEHLHDCRRMLEDWRKKVCQILLTQQESKMLEELRNPRHKLAFLAIHNFHRLALLQSKKDFAVSSEALGRAIGTSYKTAIVDLEHFITLGILERTAAAIRNISCARYCWLPTHLTGDEIRLRWKQAGGVDLLPI